MRSIKKRRSRGLEAQERFPHSKAILSSNPAASAHLSHKHTYLLQAILTRLCSISLAKVHFNILIPGGRCKKSNNSQAPAPTRTALFTCNLQGWGREGVEGVLVNQHWVGPFPLIIHPERSKVNALNIRFVYSFVLAIKMTKGSWEEAAGLQPLNPCGSAPAGKKRMVLHRKSMPRVVSTRINEAASWLTLNEQTRLFRMSIFLPHKKMIKKKEKKQNPLSKVGKQLFSMNSLTPLLSTRSRQRGWATFNPPEYFWINIFDLFQMKRGSGSIKNWCASTHQFSPAHPRLVAALPWKKNKQEHSIFLLSFWPIKWFTLWPVGDAVGTYTN